MIEAGSPQQQPWQSSLDFAMAAWKQHILPETRRCCLAASKVRWQELACGDSPDVEIRFSLCGIPRYASPHGSQTKLERGSRPTPGSSFDLHGRRGRHVLPQAEAGKTRALAKAVGSDTQPGHCQCHCAGPCSASGWSWKEPLGHRGSTNRTENMHPPVSAQVCVAALRLRAVRFLKPSALVTSTS